MWFKIQQDHAEHQLLEVWKLVHRRPALGGVCLQEPLLRVQSVCFTSADRRRGEDRLSADKHAERQVAGRAHVAADAIGIPESRLFDEDDRTQHPQVVVALLDRLVRQVHQEANGDGGRAVGTLQCRAIDVLAE